MDRRRPLSSFLTAAPLSLLLAAAAGAPILPITEARWRAPQTLLEGLTREPRECFIAPREPAERRSAAIGRVAFRAPLLLGGQAARAGLSCASCHRNGRGNPDFLFPGLSGAPGTADVTASLMSSHRGDGTNNPKPIPDLSAPASALKISRDPASPALQTFIRGLIVEEFDGPEPPAKVLRGLAAYVRGLKPCPLRSVPISLSGRLDLAEEAASLARGSDPATARLLLGAARSTLGAVDERFRLPGLEASRALLHSSDRELEAVRSGSGDLDTWLRRWPARKRALLGYESRSLYAPELLRREIRKSR